MTTRSLLCSLLGQWALAFEEESTRRSSDADEFTRPSAESMLKLRKDW